MNRILEPIIDNLPGLLFLGFMFLVLASCGFMMYKNNARAHAISGSTVKVHGINYFISGGDGWGSVRLVPSTGQSMWVSISAAENALKAQAVER